MFIQQYLQRADSMLVALKGYKSEKSITYDQRAKLIKRSQKKVFKI